MYYIARFHRANKRAGGVAIFQNKRDTANIVTKHISLPIRRPINLGVQTLKIAEICSAHCVLEDGQICIMSAIYISPNQSIADIIQFIHRSLFVYTEVGSRELGTNDHEMPLILAGDFNVNFADESAQPLINYIPQR